MFSNEIALLVDTRYFDRIAYMVSTSHEVSVEQIED